MWKRRWRKQNAVQEVEKTGKLMGVRRGGGDGEGALDGGCYNGEEAGNGVMISGGRRAEGEKTGNSDDNGACSRLPDEGANVAVFDFIRESYILC